MPKERSHALSDVLDNLEHAVQGESITVETMTAELGRKSFAATIMIFALLAASPASAIPGLTAAVGIANSLLILQMVAGRDCLWLPGFLARRTVPSQRLCQAIGWMRRPVRFAERILRPRLLFLMHRPWLFLPLGVMLCITLFMPFMEIVPTSGSLAGAVIALFAAGLLMRDGALVIAAMVLASGVPVAVWHFGFSGG